MNIFFRELRAYRRSTLIWAICLSTLVVVFLSLFPAFTKDAQLAQKILANLPAVVKSALDVSLANLFSIYGFFAFLFTFTLVAGSVQAMNLGVGILSKEESGKTVDFLLSKPVSRSKVVTSKISAAFCLIFLTNIAFSSVALIMAKIVATSAFSSKTFLLISIILLFVQIFFLALGILFSVIIPKIKSAIAVTLPTVFTFFIIGMLGALLGNDNVRYISPFKFFDPNYIINHNSYEMKFLIIEIIFVIIATIASYIIYINKDIRAVS